MDRRSFLATGATAALLPLAEAPALAAIATAPGGGDARLNALFEEIFQDQVRHSPELASSLGLDKGPNAALKSKLDTRPTAVARREDLARNRRDIARLKAIAPNGLSDAAKLNREVVIYSLETQTAAPSRWNIDSAQRPYPIFQQGGAYFDTPDFLNTSHTIDTAGDAEAYLSRLTQFATTLDNDTAEQRAQAARGFLAPAWSIDLTLGQMRKLRDVAPEASTMVDSIVRRTSDKHIAGDWGRRASAIVAGNVYPALDRQIAALERLKPTSRPGDGAGRLTNGDAIYAEALRQATTTNFTPAEVHQMGLGQVAEISSQIDAILKSQGYSQGSVGERLAALNKDPRQLYPATDAGRSELLAGLNAGVKDMYGRLPQALATVPSAPLEIRRVPPEIQDGASNGYYRRASLDGSRPAIYFINLKDVGDWPKYTLPTLSYHEGVPGHHLQISLAQESKDIPTLRKLGFFSAYSEGWALYAEQLAGELGAYANDPLGRVGFLQSFLFRAARLVVDTGLHSKSWSREQATDYMVTTTGFARPARSVRSNAIAPRSGRLAATRLATRHGLAPGPTRRSRSGRSSISSNSMRFSRRARCRSRSSSGASANERQPRHRALRRSRRPRASEPRPLRSPRGCGRCVQSGRRSDRGHARRGRGRAALPRQPQLRAPAARSRPADGRSRAGPCRSASWSPPQAGAREQWLTSAGLRPSPEHANFISFPDPVFIAAGDNVDLARAVEAERDRHRAVEEVAVMADDQHRAVIIGNHFLQQIERFEIEVVSRLVEHQQVGGSRELARQQQPRPLAARQRADRRVGDRRIEQEFLQIALDVLLVPANLDPVAAIGEDVFHPLGRSISLRC